RRRHAPAGHFHLQAALSRGRAARLRLHRLPPHRRGRPGCRLERVGLDRNLRPRPAHRAAEALRGGQAQPDHPDIDQAGRARPRWSAGGRAESAPCHTAEKQSAEVFARYGAPRTKAMLDEVLDYAERLPRAALAELPDGEWSFEDFIDDDGIDVGKPIRLF